MLVHGLTTLPFFDSFSTDRTVEIAESLGARVIQRKWDSELGQRTAMLQVPFKYKWVFNPDADEVATPEFCMEMFEIVAEAPDDIAVFRMRRKDIFQGKWIKHSSVDAWFGRLFNPNLISFERLINTVCIAHGKDLKMTERLIQLRLWKKDLPIGSPNTTTTAPWKRVLLSHL